ncbi:hypothetical protein MAPG_09282 [Magnaporthiopsis poae ATCC 64411]|uniref:G domain-containing protein n=1 Tax=Magnaporthiopsis poae (strain ATCC 64411 / 73-15) TaxID=644358 RepID=A0A0C4E9J2_MAGP6|nr:hypothetical protein MAPG_09282 [Magnaporthiopsis poae ATCC 64411]
MTAQCSRGRSSDRLTRNLSRRPARPRRPHQGARYVLIDTPGFDDMNRLNSEITESILTWWVQASFKNAVLATTFWEQVPAAVAEVGEEELRETNDFWGPC